MGWIGVETNGGAALLAQWAAGSETLYITKATVGSGYVEDANMRTATGLNSYKADAAIAEKIKIANGIKFRVRIGPSSGSAYTAHEIGIWAKLGENGTETLIQLHQDRTGGIPVPTSSESAEFVFDLICPCIISNSGTLSISIDTSVYVSNGQFMSEQVINRLMAESLPNCEAAPTFDSTTGNVTGITHTDTVTGDVKRTDTYTRNAGTVVEARTLDSGETLTITMDRTTKKTTYIYS